MTVILTILKIILLAVLALILLVLIVPFRYRAEGSRHEGEMRGTVRVSWLLHALSVLVAYDSTASPQSAVDVRLIGIPLSRFFRKSETARKKKGKTAGRRRKRLEEIRREDPEAYERILKKERERREKTKAEETARKAESNRSEPKRGKRRVRFSHEAVQEFFRSAAERGKSAVLAVLAAIVKGAGAVVKRLVFLPLQAARLVRKIVLKTVRICVKIAVWIRFAADPRTRRAVAVLLRKGKKLIRHALPKHARGHVTYGFEDPYQTGLLCAASSAFYPVWSERFTLTPDFQEKVLEGEAEIRGRIVAGYVLIVFLTLWFNRDFRYLRTFLKNQKEDKADG